VGAILGIILGTTVPKLVFKVNSALYKRDGLELLMKDYLGGARFGEALTDELLVVAYDYNSQEPRFFSKFFAKADPFIYDVPMSEATGASSAAPTFFDPKVSTNKLGLTELQIDGGIICNNPALYAY